jgi:Spy/CpxP family protein refolding chaperone
MKGMIALVALLFFAGAAPAEQARPYAGLESRAIKTLSDAQIADLKAGRGMGLALAAELNGYPGPRHAIDLAERLGLSAEQRTKLQDMFAAMQAEAIPTGARLIAEESGLNDAFARKTITPENLDAATARIGATQAALRAAHLKYHLATAAILTGEQIARYNDLRGYTQAGHARHHHE